MRKRADYGICLDHRRLTDRLEHRSARPDHGVAQQAARADGGADPDCRVPLQLSRLADPRGRLDPHVHIVTPAAIQCASSRSLRIRRALAS